MQEGKTGALEKKSAGNPNDFRIVINNGNMVVDSATLAIRWFFSDEVIKKVPTHILIVDLCEDGSYHDHADHCCKRKIVKVSEMVKFLQIHRSGKHKLFFVAFNVSEVSIFKKHFLETSGHGGYYENAIFFSEDMNSVSSDYNRAYYFVVAQSMLLVGVPDELFAKIPEKGWRRAIWNYVNKKRPEDECHSRKRYLTVLPTKIVFHGTARVLLGVFLTILLPLIRIFIFFCGWRPVGIFRDLSKAWNFNCSFGDMRIGFLYLHDKYPSLDVDALYRVWKIIDIPGKKREKIKMPITPWQIALPVGLLCLGSHSLKNLGTSTGGLPGLILVFFIFTSTMIFFIQKAIRFWIEKTEPARKLRRAKRNEVRWKAEESRKVLEDAEKKSRESHYIDWLRSSLDVNKAKDGVDLGSMIKGRDSSPVIRLRVSFWALKAKICKPYPK